VTKTKIIRFRNHESNMRTCVKLLIIFWNSEKSSGVKGIVLPSKCPFNFLYILCPRDPRGLYIYIFDGFIGLYLISLEYAKIQTFNFVV
jgi:hypothetical protein